MMRNWILFFCLIPSLLSAGNSPWVNIGPAAGVIDQVVPDRSHPDTWYVINSGRLYRTADAAQHWEFTGLVQTKQVHVISTSQLIALTGDDKGSRIWESNDLGMSFQLRASLNMPIRKIFPHPSDSRFLFATGFGPLDLASSGDGGRH